MPAILGAALTLLLAGWAQAASQDLNSLRQQVASWLKNRAELTYADSRAEVDIGPIDQRLRFVACRQFDFGLPAGGHFWGRGSVEARCLGPQPWRIYLTYAIRLNGPALVTSQALAAREPLDTTKVTLKRIDYNLAPESYLRTLPFQALASRPLAAGQPLVLDLLQLPRIVQAGRAVRVLLAGQGFSISQQAIALASASIGQTVKVKTPSGRVLLGRVTGPDQVEINP